MFRSPRRLLLSSLLAVSCATFGVGPARGGIAFTTPGTTTTITFDAGSPGVNGAGAYQGNGFDAPGGAAGTLDSEAWAVTGLSDGATTFGGTFLSGDYARGSDPGDGVGTGGVYALTQGAGGTTTLGVQPTGSDFNPGNFFLRVLNDTGGLIGSVAVAYDIFVNNDQSRSNTLEFAFGVGGDVSDPTAVSYGDVDSFDYATPGPSDTLNYRPDAARSGTLSGLSLADGDYLYLRFNSRNISGIGSGPQDELGLDNISLTAFEAQAVPEPGTLLLVGVAGLGGLVSQRKRFRAAG